MNEQNWELIGMQRELDVDEHLIWIIEKSFSEIKTPEGYKIIKKDYIKIGTSLYVRVFFVNTIPVIADLYYNKETEETSYYFAGKPMNNKTKKK